MVEKRRKTRVNIGSTFPLWSKLKDEKRLKSHAKDVTFLLDRQGNITSHHNVLTKKV